ARGGRDRAGPGRAAGGRQPRRTPEGPHGGISGGRPDARAVEGGLQLPSRPAVEVVDERLTAKQAEAVRKELAELEGPRRQEVVAAIKKAREFGDLSENFEYHAAKNEQGFLEARI